MAESQPAPDGLTWRYYRQTRFYREPEGWSRWGGESPLPSYVTNDDDARSRYEADREVLERLNMSQDRFVRRLEGPIEEFHLDLHWPKGPYADHPMAGGHG